MQTKQPACGPLYEFVGDDEYPLLLKIKQMRILQTSLNSGPSLIAERLQTGQWFVDDIIETIRLGLIGGGMADREAKRLVEDYVAEGALLQYLPVAIKTIITALIGDAEDQPESDQDAGEPMAPTMMAEDWFDGDHTSHSPEPQD